MKTCAFLLCCIFVIEGGCATKSPPSATQPTIVPIAPVEIRYDPSLHPDALTSQEKAELLQQSRAHAQSGPRAWFVYVRYNKNSLFAANIYFTPDTASPRIRKGFCAHVESWSDLLAVLKEGPSDQMERFAQISNPQEPFDERLSVPSNDMMPFDPENRFFGKAVQLNDDELVALADLVRPIFERNGGGPIFRIEERDEGIRVFNVARQGPQSSGGRYVDVKRKSGGAIELVDRKAGAWAS